MENHPTGTWQEPHPPRAELRQTAGNGNATAQTVSGRTLFNWTGPVKPDYARLGQFNGGFSGILVELPPPCRKSRTKSLPYPMTPHSPDLPAGDKVDHSPAILLVNH